MSVRTTAIELKTKGNADIHDITQAVAAAVDETGLRSGIVTVFCPSATSALTTIEYESGCVSDFQRLFDSNDYLTRSPIHRAITTTTRAGATATVTATCGLPC
jgi:thiamine phosphate synthase YjbQ (UPF0047 family)